MCGIFAFTGHDPNPDLVDAVARGAGRRGPHGHGWAIITAFATHLNRHLGALDAHIADILRDTAGLHGVLLGHARMATIGAWDIHENLQPIVTDPIVTDPIVTDPMPTGPIAVAHNGVIANPDMLYPGARTDSIALACAYHHMRADFNPVQAFEKVLAAADQYAWAIVIADDGVLYAHRHRHPLYSYSDPGGTYLSSHRFHPDATPVPENQITRWVQP